MKNELKKVIRESTFSLTPGKFIYAKVSKLPTSDKNFMISKDADEITVITEKEHIDELVLIEKNKDTYALIALNVSIPFYSIGFLATISKTIAEAGMNILIVSTYSKDYILIKHNLAKKARLALLQLGLKELKNI